MARQVTSSPLGILSSAAHRWACAAGAVSQRLLTKHAGPGSQGYVYRAQQLLPGPTVLGV